MMSVDAKAASKPLGFEGALLVADTRSFVEAWRELLASGAWPPDQVAALRERSKTLQSRARVAGVGGLAHHLQACDERAAAEPNDRDWLEECLRNVTEIAWQLEQEGKRSRAELEPPGPALVVPESDFVAPESVLPASAEPASGPSSERVAGPAPSGSPAAGADAMPPAVEPPVAEPLAVEPPVAEPLAVEPPVAEPPAAEPLAVEPLAAAPPGAGSRESAHTVGVLSELLGLAPLGSRGAVRFGSPWLPAAAEPKPALIAAEAPGLPVLELHAGDDGELSEQDLTIRLERRAVPYPLGRGTAHLQQRERAWQPWLGSWAARSGTAIPWWAGALALVVLAALAGLVLNWGGDQREPAQAQGASSGELNAARSALLPARWSDEAERLRGLVAQVHAHGRAESPELAELIDGEASLLAKALTEPCPLGSVGCRLSEQARQLIQTEALAKSPPPSRTAPGEWLSGLQLPEIGLKDDPRVRSIVQFHTENPVGREMFQGLLFQCAAHRELLHESLTRRGLPFDLIALVMVESGCVLDAESSVGARGLWQFMPTTARVYHLRVQDGVVDERLSTAKATDAALRFLGDLYGKLGSWELALASYDLGPFGLLARLHQAGAGADYWELVNAGRLPGETANYVPKIQAFALILANLEQFRFQAARQKSAEVSAELSVPSGTRLGLVARAAASSTLKIRELNPELTGDTAPGRSGESFSLRVPREAAPRARETLERLIAQADDADECVPHGFDWGRQRFTRTMATRCRR